MNPFALWTMPACSYSAGSSKFIYKATKYCTRNVDTFLIIVLHVCMIVVVFQEKNAAYRFRMMSGTALRLWQHSTTYRCGSVGECILETSAHVCRRLFSALMCPGVAKPLQLFSAIIRMILDEGWYRLHDPRWLSWLRLFSCWKFVKQRNFQVQLT